jgi:hypothetical protein
MSAKHFFFYSPGCENCTTLLTALRDTPIQNSFIYINVHNAKRIPSTLKGVPAILASGQSETNILHGKHAFQFVEALMDHFIGSRSVSSGGEASSSRSHRTAAGSDGVEYRREPQEVGGRSGHGRQTSISSAMGSGPAGAAAIVDSGGPQAATQEKDYIGNSHYEMGGAGYSDKYSFLENASAMSHRYTYINGQKGPGDIGKSVTSEPGEAIRDNRGQTVKGKQLENDLKRLQEARGEISNGIRRVG